MRLPLHHLTYGYCHSNFIGRKLSHFLVQVHFLSFVHLSRLETSIFEKGKLFMY